MKKLFTILLISISVLAFSQCPPNNPEGAGRNDKEKELNREKNRSCAIFAGDVIDTLSIDSILKSGNDMKRFSVRQLVTVTGYVTLQKYGGAESCNCHSKNKKDWDVHLEIGRHPNDIGVKAFIAEVTPLYSGRDKIDWKSFVGKKVQITGYIFYDLEHTQNAFNTNPTGTNLWRATIVEIHPVINIVIIQ